MLKSKLLKKCHIFGVVIAFSISAHAASENEVAATTSDSTQVLFVCTGNYYRSRFAEALFNYEVKKRLMPLGWHGFSRGLDISVPKAHDVSPYVKEELASRGISDFYAKGIPQVLTQKDLDQASLVVLLDREEHKPLFDKKFPNVTQSKLIYWNVPEANIVAPKKAFQTIDDNVKTLVQKILKKQATSEKMLTTSKHSYFTRISALLKEHRKSIAAFQEPSEAAARKIVEGGKLWIGGSRALMSELSWRSGGLMMTRWLDDHWKKEDVTLAFEGDEVLPSPVLDKDATTIGFGNLDQQGKFPHLGSRFGLPDTIEDSIYGWTFMGELIAAFTRIGKMPVLFETIGRYEGHPRITKFKAGEIPFHSESSVPALPPRKLGFAYIDVLNEILHRVSREDGDKIAKASKWIRTAVRKQKNIYLYLMGHLVPVFVKDSEICEHFKCTAWNVGFTSEKMPNDSYKPEDVIVVLSSQFPPDEILEKASKTKTQVIYVSIHQNRDYVQNQNIIWIDPMWPWQEAGVAIPNYDIPGLAVSGVVNSAIIMEIYRLVFEAS